MTETYDWNQRRTRRQAAPVPVPVQPVTNGHTGGYGAAALADELDKLRGTPEGSRNDQLNRSAFKLSQLVASGHLGADEVFTGLRSTALSIGLAPAEVEATLRSGHRAGAAVPRQVQPIALNGLVDGPVVVGQPLQAMPVAAAEPLGEEEQERLRTSWWPEPIAHRATQALEEPSPTHLVRDDGHPMFYSGKVNGLIGESESGKSWVALLAVVQAIAAGERVLVLDFEDSPASIQRRLDALGVTAEELGLVDYADPSELLSISQQADLDEALASHYPLIVADGVNAAMTLLGYDLNSNTDATLFATRLLRPLARTGACVVTVDHVPKNPDARGKGGIGAQAKRAMSDGCTLLVEIVEPFGKGLSGILKLTIDKDRNGAVRGISGGGQYAGKVHLDSDGDQVRIHIASPDLRPVDEREPWRPTGLMEKVSRYLERADGNPSFRAIKEAVTGRESYIKDAIAALADEGHVRLDNGPRGASLHCLLKPFRESEDTIERLSPTVSRASPGDTQASVSHPIPPYGDGRHSAAPAETSVSPAGDGDTQTGLDLPEGVSSCNHCGTPTEDRIIDDNAGYCRDCARLWGGGR